MSQVSATPSNKGMAATGTRTMKRNSSIGSGAPFLSMELSLGSIDWDLEGGLSNFVENVILPEVRQQEANEANERSPPAAPARASNPGVCPVLELTEKLGRISTGDEIIESISLPSSELGKHLENGSLGSIDPDVFEREPEVEIPCGGVVRVPSDSLPPLQDPSLQDLEEHLEVLKYFLASPSPSPPPEPSSHNLEKPAPSKEQSSVTTASLTRSSTTTTTTTKRKSSSTKSKPKRRKKRIIDETRACIPTEDDVLFGRGGFTNHHPANIKFREYALELRELYEQVSKEEKYNISQILVESVTGEGHRFLEKGRDGLWHEVIGNGARKKASQALREKTKRS